MKKTGCTLLLILLIGFAKAQTPADAIMMDKGQICAALLYGQDRWDHYWEGTQLRTNGNLGSFQSENYQFMTSIGVTKRLNMLVTLPYIHNSSSAGTLAAQRSFQDIGLWAKYRAYTKTVGKAKVNVLGELGFTTPLARYNNDILPFSVGFGATQASLRGIFNYYMDKGPYCTVNWGYTLRGKASLDREYYYTSEPHYSSTVILPNVIDYYTTLGFLNKRVKAELTYYQMITQQGSDIRVQDGPFIANRMIAGRVSALFQYYLTKPKGLSLIANAGQTLQGRNVGKAFSFGGGIAWQFGYLKSKKASQ